MDRLRTLRQDLSIVWAIAAKDIVDALKNKTTLSTILSVLLMMVVYRALPSLESAGLPPRLALYDAGASRLAVELEARPEFDLFSFTSREAMASYVGDKDIVMLGLVLPPGIDQILASADPIELEGFVVHWASAGAAAEIRSFFEQQLTEIAGRPVHINSAGNTVYTQKNSRGYPMLAALSIVFALTIVGISLVPNIIIEEKRTKTMDALLVSPASTNQVIAGKALTGLFYCLTAAGVAFAFNSVLINQWGLAILATLCGSVFTVALGLLMGSGIGARTSLILWSWIMLIPLLGAPLLTTLADLLPRFLMTILGWIPTVALSRTLRLSFSDRAPLSQFGAELLLIVGWAGLIMAGVVWLTRRADR